ncbi:hypothetical protein FZEAL_7940 [Fusarium zealandicum]|uniref:WLM domain-containing protein n=1 Tax=Fusarium zealandicum TaxID=1053134 RepID=A0A8H4XHA8_9HYPO|nr:hypothetical protein FZEAL_7940 [Fusarium zealandicum]
MAQEKDRWSTTAYQHSASFVPKLATKVIQWLDLQKDDVLLDIGCGALDAVQLVSKPELQKGTFNKAFSNAAMHWILRPEDTRAQFFKGVYAALAPGGSFTFEMGGLGNVPEMRTAALGAVARRVGMKAALAADPWFFPDEAWISKELEEAGFVVERAEREWRPTPADKGGVEGWIRLMASQLLDAVPEAEAREEAVQDCDISVSPQNHFNQQAIMSEHDALVLSYVHLASFPRASDALVTLKKVASLVKPIMRARNWKARELAEFYPEQANLLGLNVNRGQKICLRLRHAGDRNQFMSIENVVDTMLHELAHIVHDAHNSKFHALWDQLRDEHQGLVMKGYTGEGFLSEGQRLGGSRMPAREARRLAREAAEKRRARPSTGTGKRLGGAAPRPGEDIRRVIAEAAERRIRTMKGCGTDKLSESQIQNIADTATQNGFRTKADEDEANDAAIAQALWELVQEDKSAKYGNSYIPPTADNPTGNGGGAVMPDGGGPSTSGLRRSLVTEQEDQAARGRGSHTGPRELRGWTCDTCTLHNPATFLCCDACGMERSVRATQATENRRSRSPKLARQPAVVDLTRSPPRDGQQGATTSRPKKSTVVSSLPRTWQCRLCRTEMERQWWTCSTCGKMKESSR